MREGVIRAERDRIKALEREVRELRKANEILKLASAFFSRGGARPPMPVQSGKLAGTGSARLSIRPSV
jgi:transposase-like protein